MLLVAYFFIQNPTTQDLPHEAMSCFVFYFICIELVCMCSSNAPSSMSSILKATLHKFVILNGKVLSGTDLEVKILMRFAWKLDMHLKPFTTCAAWGLVAHLKEDIFCRHLLFGKKINSLSLNS